MFKLRIVTPAKKIVDDLDVKEVIVPAYRGQIDILPGHAPLVTTLQAGVLKFKDAQGAESSFAVSWGYCEVHTAGVTILADTAEAPNEIDTERAKAALQSAQKRISTEALNEVELAKINNKMKRAQVRLEVAQTRA